MLKIRLVKWESTLVYQCLFLKEKYRGKGYLFSDDETGIDIVSGGCPEINAERLYVWGDDKRKDKTICQFDFENEDIAISYYLRFIKTLTNLAKYADLEISIQPNGVYELE